MFQISGIKPSKTLIKKVKTKEMVRYITNYLMDSTNIMEVSFPVIIIKYSHVTIKNAICTTIITNLSDRIIMSSMITPQ